MRAELAFINHTGQSVSARPGHSNCSPQRPQGEAGTALPLQPFKQQIVFQPRSHLLPLLSFCRYSQDGGMPPPSPPGLETLDVPRVKTAPLLSNLWDERESSADLTLSELA